jgi:predicted DCC family thiol-disulfide oxidoreductase YuxK
VCVRALAALDSRRRIARLSFHRPEADPLLATLAKPQRRTAVHLVFSRQVISGGPAVRESVAIALGNGRLARALHLGPIARATDLAYTLIAGHRRWLSRIVLWGGSDALDDFP